MDQKKFSGIGNYILSEIFYRSKLNPFLSCKDLSDEQWRVLYDQIVVVVGTYSFCSTLLIYLLTCFYTHRAFVCFTATKSAE